MSDKVALTVKEVAGMLGISLPTAYELIKRPGFPAIWVSPRRVIVPRDAFERWLDNAGGTVL